MIEITLTLEELDLIRHATWSLNKTTSLDICEHNSKEEEDYHKTSAYFIRANEINKDLYFDSKTLRTKIIKAASDGWTHEAKEAYEKEHGLEAGDMSYKYANNEK